MVTVNEAAERLGVHYQTAYKWVREGRLPAAKFGTAYDIAEEDLARFAAAREEPASPPASLHVRDWDAQTARFHDLLVAGDELGAIRLVARLHTGGIPVLELCERVFAPALRRIGDEWAAGSVSVAEEHRASSICQWILAPMSVPQRGRPRGVCVVAAPPGESHALPAAMATAVLREARWRVHHLGADVPAESLEALVAEVRPHLTVLSYAWSEVTEVGQAIAQRLENNGVRTVIGEPGESLRTLLQAVDAAMKERN